MKQRHNRLDFPRQAGCQPFRPVNQKRYELALPQSHTTTDTLNGCCRPELILGFENRSYQLNGNHSETGQ